MLIWLAVGGNEITLPIEPFISVGGGILIAMVTGGFGLLSLWLNKRLNRIDRQGTNDDVLEALAEVKRDVGGLREENRTERQERLMLARAVSKLIEKEDTP